MIDRLVDDFFPVLEQLDDRLDLIEEHMFALAEAASTSRTSSR